MGSLAAHALRSESQTGRPPPGLSHLYPALDIPPLNLRGKLVDELLDVGQTGIDRQDVPKDFECALVEALALQDEAHARQGAEMARLEFEHVVNVSHCAVHVVCKKARRRALVPGLGP